MPDHRAGIPLKQCDDFPRCPAIVFVDQMQRHFVVRKSNDRLDALRMQLIKHIVVKAQALLVRALFFSGWEDTAPRDRHPVGFKAHLTHQGNIFCVMMVKIAGCTVRVIQSGVCLRRDLTRCCMRPGRKHVRCAGPFAAFLPAAFDLIGSRCAAPQKVLAKSHTEALSFLISQPSRACRGSRWPRK